MSNVPKFEPSILLSIEDNASVMGMLSERCESFCTTICQVFTVYPLRNFWELVDTGVLCFVKDHRRRSYFLQLFDSKTGRMIWEQEFYTEIKIEIVKSFFLVFEGDNGVIGLNFTDTAECANMYKMCKSLAENQKPRPITKIIKYENQDPAKRQKKKMLKRGALTRDMISGPSNFIVVASHDPKKNKQLLDSIHTQTRPIPPMQKGPQSNMYVDHDRPKRAPPRVLQMPRTAPPEPPKKRSDPPSKKSLPPIPDKRIPHATARQTPVPPPPPPMIEEPEYFDYIPNTRPAQNIPSIDPRDALMRSITSGQSVLKPVQAKASNGAPINVRGNTVASALHQRIETISGVMRSDSSSESESEDEWSD